MSNYNFRIKNISNRLNPDNLELATNLSDEEYPSIFYTDVTRYVKLAMKGVDPLYTRKSKEAGEKVKSHLLNELDNVEYEYQGSVMTDTHIKGNSDIDLLVISTKFYTFDREGITKLINDPVEIRNLNQLQINSLKKELSGTGYHGALEDLRHNRIQSESTLKGIYDICDCTHPKAIKIKNKTLNRDVDIVIANWYDNSSSVLNDKKKQYRGIQVYDKDNNSKCSPDYPFLSIYRINEKNSNTNGRLKKMIRFLKNIKIDSELDIQLSSFDINAICYQIDKSLYISKNKYELIEVIFNQLNSLAHNINYLENLKSVDEREYIFRGKESKINSLILLLLKEVYSILEDLKKEDIL
ncbi:hypothetical protein BBH51_07200 [Aggregatibacter actinomycetemcomitans]|uniref:cGAS/DncV-like nucleotidyltransferase C-terminal helical domain-containing protein n=3 Tax=Aggregatibacter actinomycetemcomitans TaxID=714 RepID=A0AB74N663_AGGAC|nr:nucleotidyltransferase domain-containing protein [Aggregatibacter actinomycetemcomitans]AFI88088.1 hypothetical protein D7S_02395 [Aggregatibacter actinomycetemcomitans D7S-1]ANU82454.1 hypothetical protein BBH51_07200 [Aggregatibacter actinomycetemcomitans]EKX94581.1 hypothetical protein HMPREF9996_01820 [Aggregatibacter actinomycetemcomitans Y4]KND85462.1 hypothetical protein H5P1_0203610 [Aggregatibacter actinomycetemcomitans serotype a str. H5P1]KOE65004.1 hypothetical protein I63B_0308